MSSTNVAKIQSIVGVTADGVWGSRTQAAVAARLGCSNSAKAIQQAVGVKADGIVGSGTQKAILEAIGDGAIVKRIQQAVGAAADGVWGPKTQEAVAAKIGCPSKTVSLQQAVGVKADGIVGPKTYEAVWAVLSGAREAVEVKEPETAAYPIGLSGVDPAYVDLYNTKQSTIRTNTSRFGRAGDESNLVYVQPPYPIYYDGKVYTHGVRVHKLVADSLKHVFDDVLAAYGEKRIHELHMDVYAGAYYFKKTTGGSSQSIHSWGLAIDWWPEKNALKTAFARAGFGDPVYKAWWAAWKRYGWHSLGVEKNYDTMHVQVGGF